MGNLGERELAEIVGHAKSMADAVRGAFRPPPEVAEASDDTGAVTVTVAGRGTRVTRVIVAADWRNRLQPRQLGTAVMQAVLAAQLGPVKEFFGALPAGAGPAGAAPAAPPPRPGSPPAASPQPDPAVVADLAARLSWDDLGVMLETVHKALDTVAALGGTIGTDVVPGAAAATVAGRSDNRRVEVTLHAAQLASVTIDEAWAAKAGRQQLSDSLREAFEAAYAEVPQAGPGTYAGLAADLRSVASRLGVPLPPPPGEDG